MGRSFLTGSAVALALFASCPVRAESLADAIALAYRSNPTLESSRYDVRVADEAVVQARSELRPSADLEVTGGYNRTVEGRASSRSNFFSPEAFGKNSNQAQVSVIQPLYTGGKASADRAAAEARVRQTREGLRGAEGDLLLGVITAYVDVRRYGAALDVWKGSVTELEKIIKEIEARQVAGELTRTDIAQAESQLAIAQEQVVATEEQLEAARADYAALVGRNPGLLSPEPPLPQLPTRVETAFELAERLSPELAQARDAELASRGDIVSARASGRPTVSLRGSATLSGEAVPYHLRDQDQGFAGSVVVSVPLSAGGHTASVIRQAEDRNSSDRFKIEAARRALDRNVANAWNQVVSATREARLLEQQRKSATTQLDGMINEYRVGLRSTFDVLYAQQSLRDTEVALLGATRDRYVSEATLLRQTGLLEARAIMMGVELYDPAQHLRHVESRNAVPWERGVAALDKLAKPGPHQKTLEQPGIVPEPPAIAPASGVVPPTADLSRTTPTDPIPGTIGRPVTAGRKPH